MLINLRNAMLAGKRTPTAKDYVQSGLVAMWDGIENAGWGTHDPSATTWKDLIGNLDFTSLASGKTWRDNALYCSRVYACRMNLTVPDEMFQFLQGKIASADFSMEYVFTDDGSAYNTGMGPSGTGFFEPLGADRFMYVRQSYFVMNPFYTGYGYYWPNINLANIESGGTYTAVLDGVQSEYKIRARIAYNGQSVEMSSPNGTQTIAGKWSDVVANRYATKQISLFISPNGCIGSLHCCRLYSRALTAAEIAANYAIDKARFNLP